MENNVEFFFAPSLPDCSLGNGQKLNKNGIQREILQREISQKEFEQNCNIDAQMERNRKIDSQLNFAEKQGNRGEMIALEMIKQDMKKELHKDLSAQVEEEPLKKIGKKIFSKQNENVVEKKILQQNIQIFLNRFVQEEQKNTIFEDRLEKIGSCFKSSAQAAIESATASEACNPFATISGGSCSQALGLAMKFSPQPENYILCSKTNKVVVPLPFDFSGSSSWPLDLCVSNFFEINLPKTNLSLRCCKKPLLKTGDGRYICQHCRSIWKHGVGRWKDNLLYCCGKEIACTDDWIAFYCRDCDNPRQVCDGCREMCHISMNWYHHICCECFDTQLASASKF